MVRGTGLVLSSLPLDTERCLGAGVHGCTSYNVGCKCSGYGVGMHLVVGRGQGHHSWTYLSHRRVGLGDGEISGVVQNFWCVVFSSRIDV